VSSNNILSPSTARPSRCRRRISFSAATTSRRPKPGAKGEGRAFGNTDDVILALEGGELETLSPIRLRYTGELQDMTTARDDQAVLHTDVQFVENKIINTTLAASS